MSWHKFWNFGKSFSWYRHSICHVDLTTNPQFGNISPGYCPRKFASLWQQSEELEDNEAAPEDLKVAGGEDEGLKETSTKTRNLMMTKNAWGARVIARLLPCCTSWYSEPSDSPSLPTPIVIMVTFTCFPIVFSQEFTTFVSLVRLCSLTTAAVQLSCLYWSAAETLVGLHEWPGMPWHSAPAWQCHRPSVWYWGLWSGVAESGAGSVREYSYQLVCVLSPVSVEDWPKPFKPLFSQEWGFIEGQTLKT